MLNLSVKSTSSGELVIPRFANNMANLQCLQSLSSRQQMLSPLLTNQRLNTDSCQQAMHMNMLLHQLLLGAAAMGQQSYKQLPNIPSMYGAMNFNKSTLFNGGSFPISPYRAEEESKVSSSVLLTPPLSERSRASSRGMPSPQSITKVAPEESPKEPVAGQKRQHKAVHKTKPKKEAKKFKAGRKLNLNDQSPISGIVIRRISKDGDSAETGADNQQGGDIDSKYNVVDKSEESKKKLSSIKNVIGDFVCRLCESKFADVYGLAEHRCPSIIYIEYKCPECFKVFNCPANLASHRRWHKPKTPTNADNNSQNPISTDGSPDDQL